MVLMAITRLPGPALARCELTHVERRPIDISRAISQHRNYCDALCKANIQVIELPQDPVLPDGVFVEDTAIVLDEVAVITSPAPASRREECSTVELALRPFRSIVRLPQQAYLDGGDVLRLGRTLYVGQGSRTGEEGLRALASVIQPFGYSVVPVRLRDCLHLKTACCALDATTLLINRQWLEVGPLAVLRLVDVPAHEPWGANVLSLPGVTLMSEAYPGTIELVQGLDHRVFTLDISELQKAEAGLTCMSIVFVNGGHVA